MEGLDTKNLTNEELFLLKGFLEKMEKEKTKPVVNTMTEYFLEHKSICSVCSTEQVSFFKMEKSKKFSNTLQSIPVTKPLEGFKVKHEQTRVPSCPFCEEVLKGWEKERLINFILERVKK